MDSKAMSYTAISDRHSSRIYQDFRVFHSSNRTHLGAGFKQGIMEFSKLQAQDSKTRPSVCVVGAGVAGLRCADVLLQQGFDVTILEARTRIGGRVHQVNMISGHVVDVGANWIHGTEDNPILDLANKTDTQTHSWNGEVEVFDSDGKVLPDGSQLSEFMWEVIAQAFKHSSENSATIDAEKSLYNFFEEKVTAKYGQGYGEADKIQIVLSMSELWGAFVGSSIKTQSLKFFWLEECIEGENLFVAGTYKKILDLIAKPALEGATLKLATQVTGIKTGPERVQVATLEGDEFEFDEVVMTAPLGWLKQNLETFDPPLPPRLSQAIDHVGYGSLEKFYISFPRAFWLGDTNKPDTKPFTQWLSPAYAFRTNPNQWNQEAVDMTSLPGSCAHPALLFYIFGEQSKIMAQKLQSLLSIKEKHAYIIDFFEPYISRLPHYNIHSEDCKPTEYVATAWLMDEFAGNGSYCNFQTGLKEGDKDIEIMREGLPDRHLYFAGEHTGPFLALGTVTGAYSSGEGVAERIAMAYGITQSTS